MKRIQGTTLVELIISIVILSVSATGIMMVITQTTSNSANPMIRSQGTAIAQAYMEEILAQPLVDPAGADTGSAEAGESRPSYDDVTDYNGLSDTTGARNQNGVLIDGLEGYNVSVSVAAATLNGSAARRITVTVTYDGIAGFTLPVSAYRLL
jgi:Tfp pilus assembly protein PilV